MTMFPSNPMPAAELDAAMGDPDAPPIAAEPYKPSPELSKLLERPLDYVAFEDGELKASTLEGVKRIAVIFCNANLYTHLYAGVSHNETKLARMMVAITTGAAMGLNPHASCANMAFINNKLCAYGDALVAAVRRTGKCLGIECVWDDKTEAATCTVLRKREGMEPEKIIQTFGMADAKAAGYSGRAGPWKTNPRRMCQWRARTFALRDAFADVLCGVADLDEARDVADSATSARELEAGSKLSALAGT